MLRAYETGVVAALPAIFFATLLILLYTVCHGEFFLVFMVGIVGFEPTTLASQTRCANQTALHSDLNGTWCQTRTDIVLRVKEMHNLSAQPGKNMERGKRIELSA